MQLRSVFSVIIFLVSSIILPVSAIHISEDKKSDIWEASNIIIKILDNEWGFQSASYDLVMESLVGYENKFKMNWDEARLGIAWILKKQLISHYMKRSGFDCNLESDCTELEIYTHECEKYWIEYKRVGKSGTYTCIIDTSDAYAWCNDSNQCLWICLAENSSCSAEYPIFGKISYLEDWSNITMYLD